MSDFCITPFVGYNKVKFNMSQDKIAKIDGIPPQILIDNIIETTVEYRNGSIKLTFVDGKFVDVWIPEHPADNQVYLADMKLNLFDENNLDLLKSNYHYIESKDKRSMLFPDLGICMWGCGSKKAKEGKAIIAYSHARASWYDSFVTS